MLISLCLIFLIVIPAFSQNSKSDCKKFRKGTFTYKEEPYTSVVVTRNKKTQQEHETKSGLKINYDIVWTGDCKYELIQTGSNNDEINKNNGNVLKVQMTNIFEDSYEYICTDSFGNVTEYTVVRTKK